MSEVALRPDGLQVTGVRNGLIDRRTQGGFVGKERESGRRNATNRKGGVVAS